MIFHGLSDDVVPFIFAADVRANCVNFGIPYRYYLVSGGHGCWDCEYDGQSLTELTLDFLGDYMP